MVLQAAERNVILIEGKRICNTCRLKINKIPQNSSQNENQRDFAQLSPQQVMPAQNILPESSPSLSSNLDPTIRTRNTYLSAFIDKNSAIKA